MPVEPSVGVCQCVFFEEAQLFPAVPFSPDDPGIFEDGQMLGDTRSCHLELGGNVGNAAALTVCKKSNDPDAGVITERPENVADFHVDRHDMPVKEIPGETQGGG